MPAAHRPIVLSLTAVASAAAFHDLAHRYQGFRLWEGPPAGYEPHPFELTFFLWYLLLGGLTAVCIGLSFADRAEDAADLEGLLRRLSSSAWLVPGACLAVLAASLVVKDLVLAGAPVSDDESIYVFIGKTLALGRLKNPPPNVGPSELGYFGQNFVVLSGDGWYGKYPIGHPLLLAAGELLGARTVVGPLLAAGTVATTILVGRRLIGPVGGALAGLLAAFSPQLVMTAATEHSQNTTQLTMMLGLLALLRARERAGGERAREMALAGAALGFCVLARPLPGAPFVVAAGVWVLFFWTDESVAARVRALLPLGALVAAFGGLMGYVNWVQTGNPLTTGYHAVHGSLPTSPGQRDGAVTASLLGAAVRQMVWAFGWPFSFVFLPFAGAGARHGRGGLSPIWLLLVAGYSYRLISPKVFVGSTGPIYVAEMVPLLAILTAAGMIACRRAVAAAAPRWAPAVGGVAVGAALASVTMFVPFQIAWLGRIAEPHRFAPDVLASQGVTRALVFATNVVGEPGTTWAMFPPPPPPSLDGAVIYVRRKKTLEANVAFWKDHFPDRAAFTLETRGSERVLRPLVPGSERPLRASGPSALTR